MKTLTTLLFLLVGAGALADVVDLRIQAPTKDTNGDAITESVTLKVKWGRAQGAWDQERTIPGVTSAGTLVSYSVDPGCGEYWFTAIAETGGGESAISNSLRMGGRCPSVAPMPPVLLSSGPLRAFPAAQYNGTVPNALIDTDQSHLERNSGRWEIAFTSEELPATLSTLVSRDASGTGQPGHLTVTLYADGRLTARLQHSVPVNELNTVAISTEPGAISPLIGYRASVSFGDHGFALFLDGVRLAHEPAWVTGTSGNQESMVIGASAAATGQGTDDPLANAFHGSIAVDIFAEQLGIL